MTKNRLFQALLFLLMATAPALAQETWSLERCVRYAQANSLNLKQAEIQIKDAQVSETQAKRSQLPTLNGGSNVGLNIGRSINPATNSFETQTSVFNSFSLNTGVTLFAGSRIRNSIKQSGVNVKAAQADAENASNNIALSVAAGYLQVLLSEEQLDNAKKRLDQTRRQLDQIDKLIAAGSRPQSERFDVLAQVARSEQTLVTAQNNIDIAYLNLKQLMLVDPDLNLRVQKTEVPVPTDARPEDFSVPAIYNQALGIQPSIKAGDLRMKSAEIGMDIARGASMPVVSLGASVSTNYSNRLQRIAGYDSIVVPYLFSGTFNLGNPINVNGLKGDFFFAQQSRVPVLEKDPYFNQINENLGGGVSLNINVPIFDNGTISANRERARLAVLRTQLQNQQTQQQLKTDIQKAVADARAAKKQLEAAQKTYDSAKTAFDNAEKRYRVGSMSTFDFNNARTTLDTAEVDLSVARYDYIFKLKVVDFYRGKKLTLNQ